MLLNFGIYKLLAMLLQPLERAFVVRSDQARVARHISSENHEKTADSSHCWYNPPPRTRRSASPSRMIKDKVQTR